MNLDVEQLQTLLAVVDAGSFDDASIDLGISASAVSQRIKALENRLGSILLVRARPVVPTEQGSAVLRYARQISQLNSEFNREIMDSSRVSMSIGVNSDSLATWFPPVFQEMAQWQDVSCEIIRTDENHAVDLLRNGRVSGAVTNSVEVAQGCHSEPLGVMRYHAVAAEAVADRWLSGPAADLSAVPLVVFDREDPLQQRMLQQLLGPEARPKNQVHYVPDSQQYLAAVTAGLGWGMVPEQQLNAQHGLRYLDPQWHIDVPLYFQHWAVQSPLLSRLTAVLVKAARAGGLDLLA